MKKLTSIILASLLVVGATFVYAQDANTTPPVAPEFQKGDDFKGPAPRQGWEQRQRGTMVRPEFRGGPRVPQWGQNQQNGPRFAQGPQGGPRGPMVGQGPRGGKGKCQCQCPCHERKGKGKGKGKGKEHGKGFGNGGPEKAPRHGPDRK